MEALDRGLFAGGAQGRAQGEDIRSPQVRYANGCRKRLRQRVERLDGAALAIAREPAGSGAPVTVGESGGIDKFFLFRQDSGFQARRRLEVDGRNFGGARSPSRLRRRHRGGAEAAERFPRHVARIRGGRMTRRIDAGGF